MKRVLNVKIIIRMSFLVAEPNSSPSRTEPSMIGRINNNNFYVSHLVGWLAGWQQSRVLVRREETGSIIFVFYIRMKPSSHSSHKIESLPFTFFNYSTQINNWPFCCRDLIRLITINGSF